MSDEALIAKIIKDFENTETVYTGEVLPGLCDESCRICIYASTLNKNSVICNYILVTGNRRGCAAGSGCERRIEGVRAASIDQQIYRGQDLIQKEAAEKRREEKSNEQRVSLTEEERAERKRNYDREYYMKHREELTAKMRERNTVYRKQKKKEKKATTENKSWGERKQHTKQRTKDICQGKQAEAIKRFKAEKNLTSAQIGEMIGVTEMTVTKWANEHNLADWEKLAKIGLKKPLLPGEAKS